MDNPAWTDTTMTHTVFVGLNVSSAEAWVHEIDYGASSRRVFEAVVVMTIAIMALTGNTCLWIIIVAKRFKLRKTSNAMILCLSGADMLVSSVTMPMISYTLLVGEWRFSRELCVISGFLTMLTFVASVMSLAAISINRYVIVCHPYDVSKRYTPRKTALWIAGVWMLSGSLAAPPLLGWCEYIYDHDQSICFAHWASSVSYTFFMIGVCFGGPATSMSVCYFKIFKEIQGIKRALAVEANKSMARCVNDTATMSVAAAQRNVSHSHARRNVSHNTVVKSLAKAKCSKTVNSTGKNSDLSHDNAIKCLGNVRFRGALKKAERDSYLSHRNAIKNVEGNSENNVLNVTTELNSNDLSFAVQNSTQAGNNTENSHLTGDLEQRSIVIEKYKDNMEVCNGIEWNSIREGNVGLENSECTDDCNERTDVRQNHTCYKQHTVPSQVHNTHLQVSHIECRAPNNSNCGPILESSIKNTIDISSASNGDVNHRKVDFLMRNCNGVHDKEQNQLSSGVVQSYFHNEHPFTKEKCQAVVVEETLMNKKSDQCNNSLSNRVEGNAGTQFYNNDDFVSAFRCSPKVDSAIEEKQICKNSKSPQSALKFRQGFGKTKSPFRRYQKEEIRLTISFLIAIIIFIICWFPFCITMFCSVFIPGYVTRGVNLLTLILGCLNSSVNPIILISLNNRFNKAIRALFTFQLCLPRRNSK